MQLLPLASVEKHTKPPPVSVTMNVSCCGAVAVTDPGAASMMGTPLASTGWVECAQPPQLYGEAPTIGPAEADWAAPADMVAAAAVASATATRRREVRNVMRTLQGRQCGDAASLRAGELATDPLEGWSAAPLRLAGPRCVAQPVRRFAQVA